MDMREQKFGIEIEMTGITRQRAAEVMAAYFSSAASYDGGSYEVYSVRDAAGRRWKVMYDSSIEAQKKGGGYAGSEYKVEFVSPICEYADIPVIQELIRQLRHAGAVAGKNTGIHVHINAAPHDARTLRNITNIMYSKEDLIYKALQVDVEREHRYCQKVEEDFLQELNRKKPKSLEEVSRIWYKGVDGRHRHYHESRYHCLNLHSVFQKGTIEFRLFNSTTHAGKIKAYIQLCLAISAQALNQKCASRIKTASTNEKYTFRTWLLRLGMIGDEFKTARKFLLENLEGGIAWKDPEQAVRQKERLRAMKEKKELEIGHAQQADSMEEEVPEDAQGMNMTMQKQNAEKGNKNMNMTGRRYIAYGSNLNRAQMALRCPDAKVVGTGEIKDYELLFRGNRNGAVATVEPKKGESVPVLIWEISPRDEFNLDRYEGYPRLYGKEMLEVELDGKREKMMAYTMTEGYAMGVPSEHYLATIRTGYQEAGFDEDVLMAGVEKSRERMKQEMEAERMEEAPWSQQLPL